MNKKELVDAMVAKTGSSGAAADRAVKALGEIISPSGALDVELAAPIVAERKPSGAGDAG